LNSYIEDQEGEFCIYFLRIIVLWLWCYIILRKEKYFDDPPICLTFGEFFSPSYFLSAWIAVRRRSIRAVLLIQVRSTYRNRSCETK
jgi:hypothetical protein